MTRKLNPFRLENTLSDTDKSNIKVTGFNIEAQFLDGGQTKKLNDVSDLSAAIYQICNAALVLDMQVSAIKVIPMYGNKA